MGNILVYANVDLNGNLTEVIAGQKIIPDKQYSYYFYTSDTGIMVNSSDYKVDLSTRQLIKKN